MLTIHVNGAPRAVDAPAVMPLLWALRDVLGYTGTKFGCGEGLCGACTVQLDGVAIRSCQLPIGSVGKGKVTTIEGLHPTGQHPLQKAWVAHEVPQCGYCQSGQLMCAAAFLKATPHPTDEDIRGAMSGNVCRCGTYQRMHAAIKTAAAELAGKGK